MSLKSKSFASIQLCKEQIKEFSKRFSDKHKDLHGSISKIGKVIDKNFVPDYGNLPQINIIDSEEKNKLLHQLICEHLLRNGRIDVADSLVKEADLNEQDIIYKRHFVEMSNVLEKLNEENVEAALNWCYKNRSKLKEINSTLEFNLHRLNFIRLVQQGSTKQTEALKYSRNFTPFASTCRKEIQRLMGSLLYIHTGLERSPYSNYLSKELWEDIKDEYIKNNCKLLGLSAECPLNISINAGCKALPPLVNIVQVMQQTQVGHILSKDELPIEIDVGSNNRYHSVFTCPILRQQSTDLNPPMKLVCGHVISKDAVSKLNSAGK
jgi:E3 ubiquitin-protein transferase RMND5